MQARHSLLDLARRVQSGGNADTVDFAIFRMQQINRHLVQFDRFNGVVNCISVVIVLLTEARLHRRFLSRQLDAIFVALKLQLQNRTCKLGAIFSAICRRDIAGVSYMFEP